MKTHAYNIDYLDDAMSGLGAMLDYAVNSCGEDLELFWARFLASSISKSIYNANPRHIAGMSGAELAHLVAKLTGKELPKSEAFIDMGSAEYWTGWSMAYISWYLDMDHIALNVNGLGIMALYRRYSTLHEADLSKTVQFAMNCIHAGKQRHNPLKRARQNAGMTQKQLAMLSGNTLRSIRGYEQNQRSLRSASADSVQSLSKVLGCRLEMLLA